MFIYQIENIINKKKYVGSTKDWKRRKKEHFSAAKNSSNPSYNYPLQRAIRKYGEENFIFSIIEECDISNVHKRESDFIVKLNSLTNEGWGYNQTLNTQYPILDERVKKKQIEKYGRKCALVDNNNNILETFDSYHDAARKKLNKNEASPIRVVCQGQQHSIHGMTFRDLNERGEVIVPISKTRKRKQAIQGVSIDNSDDVVYYESISEASREENIARGSISKCINGSTRYSHAGRRRWTKVN